jgi:ribosomal protein L4
VNHLARKSFWEYHDRLPKKIKALAIKIAICLSAILGILLCN